MNLNQKANLPNQNCLQAGNQKTARLLLFDKLLSGCSSSSCDGVQLRNNRTVPYTSGKNCRLKRKEKDDAGCTVLTCL
jgi:hypothetical protein